MGSSVAETARPVTPTTAASAPVTGREKRGKGTEALMLAASRGDLAEAEKLLKLNESHAGHRGEFGATPLIRAAEQGHAPIVSLLLKFAAKVDAQDDNGDSALLCACRMGHLEAVRVLLTAGADPGLANTQGTNALDAALEARNLLGRPEVSELLVSYRRTERIEPRQGPNGTDGGGGSAARVRTPDGLDVVGAPGASTGGDENNDGGGGGDDGGSVSRLSRAAYGAVATPTAAAVSAPVLRLRREDWAQDRNYPQCHLCKEAFTVFKRRHHCRICGLVFCEKCTATTLTANLAANSAEVLRVRVCATCAELHSTQPIAPGLRVDEAASRAGGHLETREIATGIAAIADKMRYAAAVRDGPSNSRGRVRLLPPCC